MTPNGDFRMLLGLSQLEIAMVLKVSRSQWSLFELGKRDLPLEAYELLVKLAAHMRKLKKDESKSANSKSGDDSKLKKLERLQLENAFQLLKVTRKINTLKRKLSKNSKALLVADYLSQHNDKKHLAEAIKTNASKLTEEDGNMDLFKLELKLELLKVEKTLLETEIKKLT